MRIAIIGAGVSGLVVAHLLHERHEVTVFEAAGYAGGHANTVRVDTPNETHEIDTGFIVFNDRNYPCFERLLERLSVASQPSTMSFGVSDGTGDFEYSGASPNGLFANRRASAGAVVSPDGRRPCAVQPGRARVAGARGLRARPPTRRVARAPALLAARSSTG